MIRLPVPDPARLDDIKADFSAQELVAEMLAAGGAAAAGITPGDTYAYVQGDFSRALAVKTALVANPALRRLYLRMVEDGALYAISQAIAASTAEFPERRMDGCRVRVVPSHAAAGTYYVIVELTDRTVRAPNLLIVYDPADRIEQLPLPAPVDGVIQLLIDEAGGVPAMLRDPKSAIFLR